MIKITVPATSANLGIGYDTLGMAVSLYSHFTFERADEPVSYTHLVAPTIATTYFFILPHSSQFALGMHGSGKPSSLSLIHI